MQNETRRNRAETRLHILVSHSIRLRSVLEILCGNVCRVFGLYSPPTKVIVGTLAHLLSLFSATGSWILVSSQKRGQKVED